LERRHWLAWPGCGRAFAASASPVGTRAVAIEYSSTAYWYQAEPHKPFPPLLPVEERLPRPEPMPTL
jgi:hypothetical protein